MFGTANQLLATAALVIGTTFIINRGKAKYAWVTGVPMVFIGVVTIYAGFTNMFDIYLPMINVQGTAVLGWVNFLMTAIIILSVVIILIDAVPKWVKVIQGKRALIEDSLQEITI